MKRLSSLLAALAILWTGCAGVMPRRNMHLQIENLSSQDMNSAEARFEKDICPWGFVARTSSAVYMFYRGDITPIAELRWWEEGRGHRVEMLDLREALRRHEDGTLTLGKIL